jgi:hypothetical protein
MTSNIFSRPKSIIPKHLQRSFDGYDFDLSKSIEDNYKAYKRYKTVQIMERWYHHPFIVFLDGFEEYIEDLRYGDYSDNWYNVFFFVPILGSLYFALLIVYSFSFYLIIQILIGLPSSYFRGLKLKTLREELNDYFDWEPVMIEAEIIHNKLLKKRYEKNLREKKVSLENFSHQISCQKHRGLEALHRIEIEKEIKRHEDSIKVDEYIIEGLVYNITDLHFRKALWEADNNFRKFQRRDSNDNFEQRHNNFKDRLEDIQKWRTLSEEVEQFDINENLEMKLKELEHKREKWKRS